MYIDKHLKCKYDQRGIYRFLGTIPKKTSKGNIEDYRLKCCINGENKKTTLQEEVDYLFTHYFLKERWQMIYHVIPFSFKDFCANILPNLAAIFKS